MTPSRIRLGTSLCLLGAPVRYNGQAKECRMLTRDFDEAVDFVAVCPEMGIGMSVPRPTIRIVEQDGIDRLVEPNSGADYTEQMQSWAEQKANDLAQENLHGFVLAKGSPSCGLGRVKVYKKGGPSHRSREGFFVEALKKRLPWLPMEDDGRLNDPFLRAHFFGRVRALRRVRDLFAQGDWSRGDVVQFHTREKFFLLAHDRVGYDRLGQLVAQIAAMDRNEFATQYQDTFFAAIATRPSRGTQQNVLEHMAGFFKHPLRPAEKAELHQSIAAYRAGELSLHTPASLIRFLATAYDEQYLLDQSYFDEVH